MIKYSVRRVINSNINLPRHRLNNEKWKLRETKRGENVAAKQREDIRAQYSGVSGLDGRQLKVTGGKVAALLRLRSQPQDNGQTEKGGKEQNGR